LVLFNRASGASTELVRGFDLQVEEAVVSPDGNTVYFTAGDRGKAPIYSVPITGGPAKKIVADVFASNLKITPDGKRIIFVSSSMGAPAEVYATNADGSQLTALTALNTRLMNEAGLAKAEEVEWTGALGRKIHGWVVKPKDFDASRKYPLLVLIHGGPQSAWNDNWGFRWNP